MANTSSLHLVSRQLAKALKATQSKFDKQLLHSRSEAEKQLSRVKSIESDLKTLQSDIDIAVHGKPMSVSLLHKAINGTPYIKARCWWHGKQREVQVGTIPAVLQRINEMNLQFKMPQSADPTWDDLKGNAKIIELVKDMAREKLRRYISKRLLAAYQAVDADEHKQPGAKINEAAAFEQALEMRGGDDWYAQWGKANQSAGQLS